ncbi:SAM-dependent methyltransferase [Methanobrevibacter sp. 87.7]|uniref:class I SAM-dependent methyltransferase n=1 Tax=Methanobrevibacter sp. 87.7 TaxID=387957 RepID=UPI000B50E90A|nr:class I SAM-dependent methyltransferase [Methanobrevibacter sp. 87.7]OWT33013.1 SAM-dependent methyltransferase [Methanobrevibacter sp. 87.7]
MNNDKHYIENPEDIDWEYFWSKKLESKKDRQKDWNKAAPHFHKSNLRDDYKTSLLKKLDILSKEDTVLDIGCGEGTITIPIAKKVKKVKGIDSSENMLKILNEKCDKENVNNVNTVLKPIEEIKYEDIGNYDAVVASRSLNSIIPIKKTLEEINKIANKYVFITLFGPENWKLEREFQEYIGNDPKDFPAYTYLINILYNMGIYANVERMDIESYREYDSIEDAIDNGKFRIDLLNDEEIEKLKVYLNKVLKKDPKTGKLYNNKDKADWILIWWKKK